MKTRLSIISLLVTFFCFSQDIFRINEKQKKELLKNGDTFIIMTETILDENEKSLSDGKNPTLNDPTIYITAAEKKLNTKLYKDICIDCYKNEYNTQKEKIYDLELQEAEKQKQMIEEKKLVYERDKEKQDSIINISFNKKEEKPYDRFLLAMDMLGKKNKIRYGQFTVFTNMDEELVRIRFSIYLQNMGYTYGSDSKQITQSNFIQEYYVRKIAVDQEVDDYIKINYMYVVNKELPSYNKTITNEYSPCWLIEKVVIEGTANSIINLYLGYWSQSRKNFGSNKTGEIAHHIFMGDHISLQYISPNKYRIVITKQGDGMDYYTSYKIVEHYNEMK